MVHIANERCRPRHPSEPASRPTPARASHREPPHIPHLNARRKDCHRTCIESNDEEKKTISTHPPAEQRAERPPTRPPNRNICIVLPHPSFCHTHVCTRESPETEPLCPVPFPSQEGTTYHVLMASTRRSRPDSGLDCLVCAIFFRQRPGTNQRNIQSRHSRAHGWWRQGGHVSQVSALKALTKISKQLHRGVRAVGEGRGLLNGSKHSSWRRGGIHLGWVGGGLGPFRSEEGTASTLIRTST